MQQLREKQSMEKKTVMVETKIFKCIDLIANLLACIEFILIGNLHFMLPFFPILFFFDLCLVIGYPLFLRYVLKRKWFECCKNKILQMKYILLPILFLEALTLLTVIISYPNEILQAS